MKLKDNKGFSLIELLIVITILAVLSAIAIPGYRSFIVKGNRSQVEQIMIQDQQYMERFYSESGSYYSGTTYPALPYTRSPLTGTKLYNISIIGSDPNSYNIVATPVSGTVQAGESSICLDSDGNINENQNSTCTAS